MVLKGANGANGAMEVLTVDGNQFCMGKTVTQKRDSVSEMFSLFVDNLPMNMNPKDLYYLFMKFGVVRDVFIPNKTRKGTRSRFGFVRYNCSVAANVSIQKANGLWCDNKALRVKMADYGKEKDHIKTNEHKVIEVPVNDKPMAGMEGRRSYAEVVQKGGRSSEGLAIHHGV
ncbi:unnamed protein product [Camellia sinensis]